MAGDYVSNHLTEEQRLALDAKRQRQIGKTVIAWEGYATSHGYDESQVATFVAEINTWPINRLKKLRKSLSAAANLSEFLAFVEGADSSVDSLEASVTPSEGEPKPDEGTDRLETIAADPIKASTAEENTQDASKDLKEPHPQTDEKPQPVISYDLIEVENLQSIPVIEGMQSLSPKALEWAKILGFNFSHDTTVDEAASKILEVASPPVTYIGKNRRDNVVDAKARVVQKLLGKSYSEIAELELESTASAVQQWFSLRIIRVTKASHSVKESDESQSRLPAPASSPSRMKPRAAAALQEVQTEAIDLKKLVSFWAAAMKLDDEKTEMLEQVLDPSYALEMNGNHKGVRHQFRLYLKDNLPALEDSDLNLTTNEIVRISRLLGRVKDGNEYKFQVSPQSVREVILDHGHLVPAWRNEIQSALQKIYDYMQPAEIVPSNDEALNTLEASLLVSKLEKVGFTDAEAIAVKACIGNNNGMPLKRPEEAGAALNKLQAELIKNPTKLSDDEDKDVLASLRSLTITAFGQKTVRDIYHKLHGKNPSITPDQVSLMLEQGIIKLVSDE